MSEKAMCSQLGNYLAIIIVAMAFQLLVLISVRMCVVYLGTWSFKLSQFEVSMSCYYSFAERDCGLGNIGQIYFLQSTELFLRPEAWIYILWSLVFLFSCMGWYRKGNLNIQCICGSFEKLFKYASSLNPYENDR